MPSLPARPIPLVALLLTAVLPTASAATDDATDDATDYANDIDTMGFSAGFTFILVVSAVEAAISAI